MNITDILPDTEDITAPLFNPDDVRSYPASELKKYDFGKWNNTAPFITDDVRSMYRAAQYYCNDLAHRKGGKAKPHWLTMCGRSGCGKTFLADAIFKTARKLLGFTAETARFYEVATYADHLRNGDYGFHSWLIKLPLLVLDDLGAEQMSDMLRAKLCNLLNAREGKWTVITTNLSPRDIAETLDTRIASRINRGFNIISRVVNAKDFFNEIKPA